MNQTDINPDQIIQVNFTGSAKALNPTVYKEHELYFCLLGNDQNGVIGSGITIEEAINDWDKNLQTRLKIGDENDYAVKMVTDLLNKEKQKSSQQIDDYFRNHLRPLQKNNKNPFLK